MKRAITFLFVFFVTLFFSINVYADNSSGSSSLKPEKVIISIKSDVMIQLNGVKQEISDSNGFRIYPVIYEGYTYLPVRAVAELMNKPIEWDSSSKTVFIGKTISNPSGTFSIPVSGPVTRNAYTVNSSVSKSQPVEAYLKPDILIMYNFVLQTFEDANGKAVYPIIYNGTTYLPLRAVSEMMDKTIEWDAVSKTVNITDAIEDATQGTIEAKKEISKTAKTLKGIFEREELLYYEATARTTSLKAAATLEDKRQIASKISADLASAQKLTLEITLLDTFQFTEEELIAYNKTKALVESTEYYIQVLENIAYLAAQDSDYSMLADTFLYFAMDSQTKMEDARGALQILE